jgi:hypothetical protein
MKNNKIYLLGACLLCAVTVFAQNVSLQPPPQQLIVQPIHDFHFNRKLASLVEFKGKNGGKILICGYNLKDNIEIIESEKI